MVNVFWDCQGSEFVSQVMNVVGRKRLVDDFLDDRDEVIQRADRTKRRSVNRTAEAAG